KLYCSDSKSANGLIMIKIISNPTIKLTNFFILPFGKMISKKVITIKTIKISFNQVLIKFSIIIITYLIISKLFPVSTIMVIVIKNIIATETVLIKIIRNDFETSFNRFETFFGTIGSTTAPAILYINSKVANFIIGMAVIKTNTNKPMIPMPFFNIAEDP